MAKTVEQHQEDIQKQREKIKAAEAAIKKSEAAIRHVEEAELLEVARQLRAAGKLQDAKKLLAGSEQKIGILAAVQAEVKPSDV